MIPVHHLLSSQMQLSAMELKLGRKNTCSSAVLLILCTILLLVTTNFSSADEGEQQCKVEESRNDDAPEKPSLWKMTRNAFPPYTSSPLRIRSYLEKAIALLNQGQAYIFPPSLDFRGSGNNIYYVGEEAGSRGGGGAGEKVREAVGNSFGKSKETVDSSAKSAAKLVGETVQKTKEKVKRSFSDRESGEPESEL